MLARMARQTVPFVLVNEADQAEFSRAFPAPRGLSGGALHRSRTLSRDDEDTTIAVGREKRSPSPHHVRSSALGLRL